MAERPAPQPTYDELLARVAQLEARLDLRRGTPLAQGELPRPDAALDEARATLNAIIESTTDLIWAVDAEHFSLLMFNQALRNYFLRERGMTIESGLRPEAIFPSQVFVRRWRDYYARALRDGPFSTEYAVYAGTRTLELSFNLMIRNGHAFGISVFGRDITERKAADEALQKSEQKFRQITEESPVAIYIIQGGRLVYVNPSLARQAGYSREEIVGNLAPQDLVHRNDVARLMTTLGERAAGKIQGEAVEYRGIRKDGSIVHIEAYGMLMEYQGKPAVMGTLIDITERKRLEAALSGSESRLRMALAAANAGAWEWDLRTQDNTWSDEVWKLYGVDRDHSPPASYQTWRQLVHPDDLPATEAAVQEAARTGAELCVEWRVNTTDGTVRWLMTRGRPERDAAGKLVKYMGVVVDISERKAMQEALRHNDHSK